MTRKKKIFFVSFVVLFIIVIPAVYFFLKSPKKETKQQVSEATTISAEVTNWNFTKQLLETKEYPHVLFKVTVPQTRLIIPLNKPDKPKDERLVMSDKSTWWPTVFCPTDKLEIQLSKEESLKLENKAEVITPLRIRNLGPRNCAFLAK